nr:LpqB family beta-propeller domain-containing protein [Motilibacter aurantiacus]
MLALPVWFADPGGRALVPDQVYLPKGDDDLAASLTRRLLAGPGPGLQGAVRSAIPAGTRLLDASVVSGEALVELAGPVSGLSQAQRDLALAQLSRSLSAVPGVDGAVRVTLGATTYDATGLDSGYELVPERLAPGPNVLVIDGEGRLQTLDPAMKDAPLGVAPGKLAAFPGRLRHPAMTLPSTPPRLAALSNDQRGLQVQEPDGTLHRLYLARPGPLAPPAFDAQGNVWTVDRGTGTVLVAPPDSGGTVAVQVPTALLEGYLPWQVEPALDGARVALVLRSLDGGELRVVVAAVLPPEGESGMRLGGAPVPLEGAWQQVYDLDWRSPTSLVMLVESGDNSRALFVAPSTVTPAEVQSLSAGVDQVTAPPTRTEGALLAGASTGRGGVFVLRESPAGLSNALRRGVRDPAYAG